MKKILIFVDRDGTLIYDKKYYLGSQNNWKSKVKFLPYVIRGLKLLNKNLNPNIYMITNQPGVAIKNFPLLTLEKAHEVSLYVMKLLEKKGVFLKGYDVCGKAHLSYARKRSEFEFDKKLIGNFSCIKPKPGMINIILKNEKLNKEQIKIYVIGDRFSDVKTALNAKGCGIMVPFKNEKGEKEKVRRLNSKNKYIAKNFLGAAKIIINRENYSE